MHTKDLSYIAKLGFADKDKSNERHDLACRYLAQPEKLRKLGALFDWRAHTGNAVGHMDSTTIELFNCDELLTDGITRKLLITLAEKELGIAINDSSRTPRLKFFLDRTSVKTHGEWIGQAKPSDPILRQDRYYASIIGYYDIHIHFTYYETFHIVYQPYFEIDGVRMRLALGRLKKDKLIAYLEDNHNENADDLYPDPDQGVFRRASTKPSNLRRIGVEVKASKISVTDLIQQLKTYETFDSEIEQVVATCYSLSQNESDMLKNLGYKRIHITPESLEDFKSSTVMTVTEAF